MVVSKIKRVRKNWTEEVIWKSCWRNISKYNFNIKIKITLSGVFIFSGVFLNFRFTWKCFSLFQKKNLFFSSQCIKILAKNKREFELWSKRRLRILQMTDVLPSREITDFSNSFSYFFLKCLMKGTSLKILTTTWIFSNLQEQVWHKFLIFFEFFSSVSNFSTKSYIFWRKSWLAQNEKSSISEV